MPAQAGPQTRTAAPALTEQTLRQEMQRDVTPEVLRRLRGAGIQPDAMKKREIEGALGNLAVAYGGGGIYNALADPVYMVVDGLKERRVLTADNLIHSLRVATQGTKGEAVRQRTAHMGDIVRHCGLSAAMRVSSANRLEEEEFCSRLSYVTDGCVRRIEEKMSTPTNKTQLLGDVASIGDSVAQWSLAVGHVGDDPLYSVVGELHKLGLLNPSNLRAVVDHSTKAKGKEWDTQCLMEKAIPLLGRGASVNDKTLAVAVAKARAAELQRLQAEEARLQARLTPKKAQISKRLAELSADIRTANRALEYVQSGMINEATDLLKRRGRYQQVAKEDGWAQNNLKTSPAKTHVCFSAHKLLKEAYEGLETQTALGGNTFIYAPPNDSATFMRELEATGLTLPLDTYIQEDEKGKSKPRMQVRQVAPRDRIELYRKRFHAQHWEAIHAMDMYEQK